MCCFSYFWVKLGRRKVIDFYDSKSAFVMLFYRIRSFAEEKKIFYLPGSVPLCIPNFSLI